MTRHPHKCKQIHKHRDPEGEMGLGARDIMSAAHTPTPTKMKRNDPKRQREPRPERARESDYSLFGAFVLLSQPPSGLMRPESPTVFSTAWLTLTCWHTTTSIPGPDQSGQWSICTNPQAGAAIAVRTAAADVLLNARVSQTHEQWCTVRGIVQKVGAEAPDHRRRSALRVFETGEACQRSSHR
eukprot:CAMPEP_0174331130 /NCGR_PEP_ID=MMETSP0810-20121108/17245_1 /TAXON_ID=73025 ORGANISM="Eutreptiella gymnastica-like, Strain CCMP1594" /NCGR_SAMPLE_ID=MMETSP0810 /ASSEMBLY_ACC=CAM_ASM_000659 /LENGTH=183 /DNA_ID=CAMNT_0015446741 /DNA_START=1753 /DNA_END=2301 /DNA_ORIENTATION=+